ncbi:MAG: ParB/RepB/Spo0J family partition protein, partial [Planctomycetes bacterium]|nr:ParB/RepB/Spo0J family partition protein [Planctomycetota bacterium]
MEEIGGDGGAVLATYRDPLGEAWQVLAALPIEKVRATPYQRDLSEAHVKRLAKALEDVGRFLDPVIAVRTPDGFYETPNGRHRTETMRQIGARSIVALVIPEAEMAFKILALNVEKAHNVRERSLEAIRMARELARIDDRPEKEYASVFEEPQFLTLGLCYERNGRFSGGAYSPVLKRTEEFLGAKLGASLGKREGRRDRLLALDEAVGKAVKALKDRGFESPYLKSYVIARVNPLRFVRGKAAAADFDETLDKMERSLAKFDPAKV